MRLARHAETGERVAVKIVPREVRRKLGERSADPLAPLAPVTDEKVLREIAILKKCQHPNVVQLKEVIDDPHSRKIFLILEYMARGEVHWKDAAGHPTLTVEETRRIIRDVVLGLEFLHHQGIVHRDIKPANLLWDEDYNVKISDFGVSHLSSVPTENDEAALAKTAGSPAFFAPELCLCGQGKKGWPITKAIDVWALGVTLYCLLFGQPPFMADTEYALFNVIPYEDYALPATMGADAIPVGPRAPRFGPQAVPEQDAPPLPMSCEARLVRDLLDRLLEKNPNKRITLEEVRHHPWIVANLANADHWLQETDPAQMPSVHVSHEEVHGALTGLPRLRKQMKQLRRRLTETLSGPRRVPSTPSDESGATSPSSTSSKQSLVRLLRGSGALGRTTTLPSRPKMPTRSQSERQPVSRATSAGSLWLAPGMGDALEGTAAHGAGAAAPDVLASASLPPTPGALPSAVMFAPRLERLRLDAGDGAQDWSDDDDLDEDLESHSSGSRRSDAGGARACATNDTP